MDHANLKELQDMLLTRKDDLQKIIVANQQILREQLSPDDAEIQTDANHPADLVNGDPDYDKEINLIKRERAELALVTGALARMEQGQYGNCLECEEEIPIARLKALPYAKYCMECMKDKDAESNLRRSAGAPEVDPHSPAHLGL